MPATLIAFTHILSLVCWLGSVIFLSFFAAPAIFKTLEREQAGEVVGKIFPKYYVLGYVCGVLILVTLLAGAGPVSMAKLVLIVFMLACSLAAGLGVGPRARKLKGEIKATVSTQEREALEAKFKTLHALSVQLNGAVLFAGLAFLWLTAGSLSL